LQEHDETNSQVKMSSLKCSVAKSSAQISTIAEWYSTEWRFEWQSWHAYHWIEL